MKTDQKNGGAPEKPVARTTDPPAQTKFDKQIAVPGADYIPCKFTLAELRGLQAPDIAPTLSPAQVEELQTKVVNSAAAQNSDPSITGPALSELISSLSNKSFTDTLRGLTPSQALNQVITKVRDNRNAIADERDTNWYASIIVAALVGVNVPAGDAKKTAQIRPASPAEALESLAKSIRALAGVSTRGGLFSQVQRLVLTSQLPQNEETASLVALSNSKPLDEQDLIDAARHYLAQFERPPDVGCAMSLLSWREVEFAFGYLIANEYIAVQVVVRNLNDKQEFVLHDVEFEVDADPSGRLGRFYSGRDKVVVRALANTQSTGDPRNIVMSVATGIGGIMSAAQTVFKTPLADAAGVYNSAFLPALGKGWKDLSGDQLKMIDDNTFSSTASSQQSVPKSGTVVFYTFIPAKQFQEGWWTQPCVEKTYVGTIDTNGRRSGLSRGVYAQQWPASAAEAEDRSPGSRVGAKKESSELPLSTVHRSEEEPPAGIDVQRALAVCAQPDDLLPRHHSKWSTMLHQGPLLETAPDTCLAEVPETGLPISDDKPAAACKHGITKPTTQASPAQATEPATQTSSNMAAGGADPLKFDLFRNAYSVPYRKWSPNSLAIFRELANTVVAGVHIVDEDQLQPDISQLKCPVDDKGVIDFSKVDKDELPCTLTGRNLDKYSKLRLRNAADAVDPQTLDAAVAVTGDNTNAAVNWSADGLHGLKDINYLVYAVGLNGTEQKTSQGIHLDSGPYVVKAVNTGTNDANFDGSKGAATQTLQLTGFHLENVRNLTLTPLAEVEPGTKASPRKAVTLDLAKNTNPSDKTATFTFDTTELTALGEGSATLTLQVAKTRMPNLLHPSPSPAPSRSRSQSKKRHQRHQRRPRHRSLRLKTNIQRYPVAVVNKNHPGRPKSGVALRSLLTLEPADTCQTVSRNRTFLCHSHPARAAPAALRP